MRPIEDAESLLEEIQAQRLATKLPDLEKRAAWAIDNQRRIAEGLENLLEFLKGYREASQQEQRRLVFLVSTLLSAIAPLFEAPQTTPFGRPSDHSVWLNGTAPRLRRAFIEATQYLQERPK